MEQWEAKGGARESQISELSLWESVWEWREVTGHHTPGMMLGPGETMVCMTENFLTQIIV